jgi:hypothetical protein
MNNESACRNLLEYFKSYFNLTINLIKNFVVHIGICKCDAYF